MSVIVTPPIFLIFLFIALLIAAYRDVKTREVPDSLNYCLIVIGLLGSLIIALENSDLSFFLEHLAGFGIGFAVGMAMFYGRQWGGGDAKLIMGVGAILGFSYANLQLPEFLILLVLCGALYGVLFTLYLALVKHRRTFLPAFKQHLRTPIVHRLRITLVCSVLVLLAVAIFVSWPARVIIGFLMVSLYLLVYSWIFMNAVERNILIREYPVGKLTEGDWVAQEVKVGKNVIITAKNTGITLEQIAQIRKSKIKKVIVKEGIAFVPSFFLAFIVLLLLHAIFGSGWLVRFFFS